MISETKEAPQSERPVGGFENNRRGRETEVPQPALRISESKLLIQCSKLIFEHSAEHCAEADYDSVNNQVACHLNDVAATH